MLFLLNIQHAYKVAHRTYPIRHFFDPASVAVGYGQKRNLSSGNTFYYKNKCKSMNPKCYTTQKNPDSVKDNAVQNICKTTTSDDIVKKMLERYEKFEQELSSKKIDDFPPPCENEAVVMGFKGIQVTNGDIDVMTFATTSVGLLDPKLYQESLKAAARNREKVSKTASEPALFDRESRQTTTPEFGVNRSMSSDRTLESFSKYVPQFKPGMNNPTFQETSLGPKPELISEIGLREKPRTIHKAVDSLSVYENSPKSGIISKSAFKCSPPKSAVTKSNSFESKKRTTPASKISRVKCPCKKKMSPLKCDSDAGSKSKEASSTSIPDLNFWKNPAIFVLEGKCGQTVSTVPSTRLTGSTNSKPENASKSESQMNFGRPTEKDIRPTCKKSADDYKSNASKSATKAKCGSENLVKPPDGNKNRRCLNYKCPDSANASKSEPQMNSERPTEKHIRPTCKKSADDYKSNACKSATKAKCESEKPPDGNKNRRCLNYRCPDSAWNEISDDG